MIDAGQMKAARSLLGWNQTTLAERSGLSLETIKRMESKGTSFSTVRNVQAVEDALAAAGCTFLPDDGKGRGVRAKAPEGDE
ncbi:transcriptional regulator [Metarhizobium album]|uniref:Transcriptional regulator n=1 Tax=Metarhizobium album TaxID=2182425 RepID=A0A2U2DVF5_9HYPH|nr:transcriptional regulator [Rhizobium album]